MRGFGPRALTPGEGRTWLIQAWQLMWRRPRLFIPIALLAPSGSVLLLAFPIWEWGGPLLGGWMPLVATVFCYGLPLSTTVILACGCARAVNRQRPPAWRQLCNRTAFRVLARTSLFLFILLLQGYMFVYWVQKQWFPETLSSGDAALSLMPTFGVTHTLLGTMLSMLGGMLLVLQTLMAIFIIPLHLFRELSLAACWRRSVLAMQLNPWLFPFLGLLGLALAVLPFLEIFAIPAQILALPVPVYLGVLLYVAWNEIFQGGTEEEEVFDLQEHWNTRISEGPASCQSGPKRLSRLQD